MEETLLHRLKQGDELVFKSIYNEYYTLLCRLANQLLNDSYLAEEIVDDVLFYVWEHREELEITNSFRGYLLRFVRNRCLNQLKSSAHTAELSLSSFLLPENIEFLDTVFVEGEHPLGTLMSKELEERIDSCMDSLPKECRLVFKKSRLEHKKYEEIAEEIHISVNTVKYHIKNALAFMHQHLKEYMELVILFFLCEK